MFSRFRRKDPAAEAAARLYGAIAARARAPVFFRSFAVPDTIDGRFDLLTLHAFLVLDALAGPGKDTAGVGTALVTRIFAGFEDALRDLGISDYGMSRRIKAMADAFYGRLEAYARVHTEDGLAEALVKNVYRGNDPTGGRSLELARYVLSARRALDTQSLATGDADFGALP